MYTMQSVQNLFSTANNKVETTQNKKKNHGHHSYDNEILFDRNLITLFHCIWVGDFFARGTFLFWWSNLNCLQLYTMSCQYLLPGVNSDLKVSQPVSLYLLYLCFSVSLYLCISVSLQQRKCAEAIALASRLPTWCPGNYRPCAGSDDADTAVIELFWARALQVAL